MGKSRYAKAQQLLKDIIGQKLHKNKLWRRIMVDVGSDERTIRELMNLMISLGMIHECEQDVYEIITIEADL